MHIVELFLLIYVVMVLYMILLSSTKVHFAKKVIQGELNIHPAYTLPDDDECEVMLFVSAGDEAFTPGMIASTISQK